MLAEQKQRQFDEIYWNLYKSLVEKGDLEGQAIMTMLRLTANNFPHDLAQGENPLYDRIVDALTGVEPFDLKKVKGTMDELQMLRRSEEEFPGGSIDG